MTSLGGRVTGRLHRSATLAGRIATSGSRRRPDYLILGTERGGTTALHVLLAQHPEVRPPLRKEIH
ncbi:MAG: sulfotransferase, partial [Acidimicrobiia bacterium]